MSAPRLSSFQLATLRRLPPAGDAWAPRPWRAHRATLWHLLAAGLIEADATGTRYRRTPAGDALVAALVSDGRLAPTGDETGDEAAS
jgi:hypothetical protein